MIRPYWVKFSEGAGCVEAENKDEAKRLGSQIKGIEAIDAEILPYPAYPRLNLAEHETLDGTVITIPSFCRRPKWCKGKTSCPNNPSCAS